MRGRVRERRDRHRLTGGPGQKRRNPGRKGETKSRKKKMGGLGREERR